MKKKTVLSRSFGHRATPVSDQDRITYHYRVVYSNGLNEPVETLVGSEQALELDDEGVSEAVCQFVQTSIDMDCRQLLFVYQEFPITD